MLRYYMTPETRQSLIEESNRLIAMRAIANAARGRRVPGAGLPLVARAADDGGEPDGADAVSESAFAKLVADLEATARTTTADARSA